MGTYANRRRGCKAVKNPVNAAAFTPAVTFPSASYKSTQTIGTSFNSKAFLGFNFGEKKADANPLTTNADERFANTSLFLPVSVFLSYFPSHKSTLFVNTQQAFLVDLGNDFFQNYTQLGLGGKYQLTEVLNLEASFGKIVRGHSFQGLGQTFSLGLRAIL